MSEHTEVRTNLPPDRRTEVWYKGELVVSTIDGSYAGGFEDGFDRALDMLAAVTQERDALAARVAALKEALLRILATLTAPNPQNPHDWRVAKGEGIRFAEAVVHARAALAAAPSPAPSSQEARHDD